MADATVSNLGQVNHAGVTDALFLKVYSGEVLTAFERAVVALKNTSQRSISSGKSAQFPATGRQTAAYHVPGTEILGNIVDHAENVIVIDQLLISPAFIADIDEAMNHYDVRSVYSNESGLALAFQMDANILQTAVLAARATNVVTSLPGGASLVGATFKTDKDVLATGLFTAAQTLDEKAIPETDRTAYFRPAQYYLLAQNTTAINQLFGGKGSFADGTVVSIGGINLQKSLNLPITNITTGPSKYQVNAATTAGLVMHKCGVGTVKLMDLSMQSEYSVRRQGTLMVARYAVGHGILRPDACVELKTS